MALAPKIVPNHAGRGSKTSAFQVSDRLRRAMAVGLLATVALTGCDSGGEATTNATDSAVAGQTDGTIPSVCDIGARRCVINDQPQICEDGTGWVDAPACPGGQACTDGRCEVPLICEAAATRCGSPVILETCAADGTGWEPITCGSECIDAGGVASCTDLECIPGERRCNGTQTVAQCNAAGSGFEFVERCGSARADAECSDGECVPLCDLNKKVRTNVGCEYWAVDLDNALVPGGERGFLDAAGAPYAVVISNPHPDFTAEVSVFQKSGIDAEVELVQSTLVPPLGLHAFMLPRRDVDGTVKSFRAYSVRASIPIVAYQFNPLDNEEVFSNDASLLLPSHVLGDEYYIMTREQSFESLRGYLTVVGIDDEPTQVSVTVTAPTQPGVGGIPALAPGDTFETVLRKFEVLNIETQAPGADLTGSHVQASANVVVFGGSEAANAPNTNHCINQDAVTGIGQCEYDLDAPCETNYDCNEQRLNTCCADHLEQQLFPVSTWGRHYVATKSFDRGNENDYWRILAAHDNTKIETIPAQAVVPTLNEGEFFEFGSREHFEIISDKPIMVGQFLASEQAPNPNLQNPTEPGDAGIGDPAFILAVPVEQYRANFVVLAPDKYAEDYISVIAPAGALVFFDEEVVPRAFEPVGDGSSWQVARFPVGDGVHFLESDDLLSVIVYGYDQFVSYGYPGGLNLDVVSDMDPVDPPAPDAGIDPPTPDAGIEPPTPDAGIEPPTPDAGVDPVDAAGADPADAAPDVQVPPAPDAAVPAPDAAG